MMNQGRIRARAIGKWRRAVCPGIWRRGSCQERDIPCGLPVLLCWSRASMVPWFPQPAGLTRHILLVPSVAWPANHSYLDTLGLKHLAFKIPTRHPHCTLCSWGLPSLATFQYSVSVQPAPIILFQGSMEDPSACLSVFPPPLCSESTLQCFHVISPCPFLHVHF